MTSQMPGKKPTLRRCIGCFEFKDKKTMVRLYKDNTGHIKTDMSFKAGGRGAYICGNPECVDKAKKRKALEHSFKMKAEDSDYTQILKELEL